MKSFPWLAILFLFPLNSHAMQWNPSQLIDLSHPYNAATIYWPTEPGFDLQRETAGMTEKGYFYAANRFCAPEHGGTHIDAPYHFAAKGETVDQVPLERLMGNAILVDVSAKAEKDRDYQIQVDDLTNWEKSYGKIPENARVVFRTGYYRHWPDRAKYLGTAVTGPEAVRQLHFPGLSPAAAQWLAEQRRISAVGIDTASIDYGQSTQFETHRTLFAHNIPAFENLANLASLPEIGFSLIALPMKIEGGSGAPLRAVAILDAAKATPSR